MKKVLIAVVVVVVGLVAVVGFLVARIDPDEMGQAVLRRLNESEGLKVSAERFHLGIFDGLQLEEVTLFSQLESGRLEVRVASAELEHELWPLLRRQLVIHQVVLVEPVIEVISAAPAASEGAAGKRPSAGGSDKEAAATKAGDSSTAGVPLTVDIASVRMENGTIVLVQEGPEASRMEIADVDILLENLAFDPLTGIAGFAGSGTLKAASLTSQDLSAENIRADIAVADGQVTLTEAACETSSADLEISQLTLDLTADPLTYEMAAGGQVDLNSMLAESGGGFGGSTLTFNATGVGSDPAGIVGTGSIQVGAGTLPAAPIFKKIEALIGREVLSGKPYEATRIDFSIAGDVVSLQPFELASEFVKLGADGSFSLSGPMGVALQVLTPREGISIDGAGNSVLDAMTNADGWITLPFDVTGTISVPDVDLDMGSLKDNAVDVAKDAAKKELEKEGSNLGNKLLRSLNKDKAKD